MHTKSHRSSRIHGNEPRFADLSHDGQVALAAWMVLLKSVPPGDGFVLPDSRYGRAVGDIAATVGLRDRKQRNFPDLTARRRTRRGAA